MREETWRSDLLRIVLRTSAVLGAIVYVPSVWLALSLEINALAVMDTVALAIVLALAYFERWPVKVRAIGACLVLYVLGAGLMFFVGPISQIYLFASSLFCTLLVSARWSAASVALNAVTMLAIGLFSIASPEMVVPHWDRTPIEWIVVTVNFVFVNTCLVLALGTVISALESALAHANAAREALELEGVELVKLNESLALEVRDRVRTEASLHESKILQRIAGRAARVGGWLVDMTTQRVVWSEEMCELHEMPAGTTPTFSEALALYAPEWRDALSSAFNRCLRDGTPLDEEVEIITAKGTRLWARVIGARNAEEEARTTLHGALQDITRQKRAEARNQKLEGQLRQAQKMEAVGQLAGGVAHDFNNMLSVILGNAHLTLSSLDADDPRREDMQEVVDAARRSADLTGRLLAFARQQPIAPVLLELNAVVESSVSVLRRLIGEDIDLLWRPGANVPPIMMDRTQVEQILTNLAVNARDAIASVGTLVIETGHASFDAAFCATHAGYALGDYVRLSVSDSGCGMDKETLAKAFEPFFTTKEVGKGTGLGLATVYGIVQQNGGFISVHSEPGQGATFLIYLPQHSGKSASRSIPTASAVTPGGRETVLLVEDEDALLRVAARMLKGLGYAVVATTDPREAIALAAGHPTIDMLITDVIMPHLTGRELWQELRKARPELKCLFMSGYAGDVISHRGVLEDGVHFLQKPFALEALARKIRHVLDH
jgi:signal transduction histidine kinase